MFEAFRHWLWTYRHWLWSGLVGAGVLGAYTTGVVLYFALSSFFASVVVVAAREKQDRPEDHF